LVVALEETTEEEEEVQGRYMIGVHLEALVLGVVVL
jgi:hypothetical protein